MEDRALIEGALAGRQQDFEVLVERYQKMVYAFVYRYLRDADGGDDVVQSTFVQAYTHLRQFRGTASFKTWLHQIALNQCRSRSRSMRARREVALEDVPESVLPATNPDARGRDLRADVERHIERLPQRQRTVLRLRVFSDLPFKEIARLEGISENSAKVNYHHAITRLKQWLG